MLLKLNNEMSGAGKVAACTGLKRVEETNTDITMQKLYKRMLPSAKVPI